MRERRIIIPRRIDGRWRFLSKAWGRPCYQTDALGQTRAAWWEWEKERPDDGSILRIAARALVAELKKRLCRSAA